jgi:DNA primase
MDQGEAGRPEDSYRLPELLAAPLTTPVYITEGEKDAESLAKIGFVATSASEGAGKWKPELNEYFRDRRVVILPDADEPGRKHAQKVASALQRIAERLKVVDLYPDRDDARM